MLRHYSIFIFVLFLSACGSSPKTHFYVLNSTELADNIPQHTTDGVAVGVWSVNLPRILDRSEIVTREGPHKIELAAFHRWAGELNINMTRLIADTLSKQLQTNRIVTSPWPSYSKNDYQVKINVHRFDGELGGVITLSGNWSLLSDSGSKEISRKPFTFTAQSSNKTYSEMVAQLSRLTIKLAEQIGNEISRQK